MGAERQRQMVAAWVVFWTTLGVVVLGGVVLKMLWEKDGPGGYDPRPSVTVADVVVGATVLFLILVGGMWTAWRLNTGGWGPRRRPTAATPAAGEDREGGH
jgi:hypothetical protein